MGLPYQGLLHIHCPFHNDDSQDCRTFDEFSTTSSHKFLDPARHDI